MEYQPDSFTADTSRNGDTRLAMRAALRDLRKEMRRSPVAHPLRDEMLGVLADARVRIDRINARTA